MLWIVAECVCGNQEEYQASENDRVSTVLTRKGWVKANSIWFCDNDCLSDYLIGYDPREEALTAAERNRGLR